MGKSIQIAHKQPKNLKQLVGGPAVGGGGEAKQMRMQGARNVQKIAMHARFYWRGTVLEAPILERYTK